MPNLIVYTMLTRLSFSGHIFSSLKKSDSPYDRIGHHRKVSHGQYDHIGHHRKVSHGQYDHIDHQKVSGTPVLYQN